MSDLHLGYVPIEDAGLIAGMYGLRGTQPSVLAAVEWSGLTYSDPAFARPNASSMPAMAESRTQRRRVRPCLLKPNRRHHTDPIWREHRHDTYRRDRRLIHKRTLMDERADEGTPDQAGAAATDRTKKDA